jgi:hypothetical protein
MGVERAVTRWYLHRQMLLNEIASIEERLRQLPPAGQQEEQQAAQAERARLQEQLAAAQAKLRRMGDNPRPMM